MQLSNTQPMPDYAHDGYAALGLARNPFVAEQEAGTPPDLWLDRDDVPSQPPHDAGQFVQIVGVRGAGKTSLMLHWQKMTAGVYHYVDFGRSRWQLPPLAPFCYWDELDRMVGLVRMLALSMARLRGMTIIAGTHVDLAWQARISGLRCTTIHLQPLSVPLLQQLATKRIHAVMLDPIQPPKLMLDQTTAQRILDHAGSSWREALVQLHIWASQRAQHQTQGLHRMIK